MAAVVTDQSMTPTENCPYWRETTLDNDVRVRTIWVRGPHPATGHLWYREHRALTKFYGTEPSLGGLDEAHNAMVSYGRGDPIVPWGLFPTEPLRG